MNIRKIPFFNCLPKNGIYSHRRMSRLDIEVNIFDMTSGYYLGAFIRNDGAPALVDIATVCGGVFNIFGDIF